jgi:phosphotransacetylase
VAWRGNSSINSETVPTYARRMVITDVALNIAPDTDQKRDICQNAIGYARPLGIDVPKVAILAAVETVRTRMPATLDGGGTAAEASLSLPPTGWRHPLQRHGRSAGRD